MNFLLNVSFLLPVVGTAFAAWRLKSSLTVINRHGSPLDPAVLHSILAIGF